MCCCDVYFESLDKAVKSLDNEQTLKEDISLCGGVGAFRRRGRLTALMICEGWDNSGRGRSNRGRKGDEENMLVKARAREETKAGLSPLHCHRT